MQKNRNRVESSSAYETRPQRRSAVSLPEVVNVDDLGIMLDEDLIVRLRSLEDDKGKAYDLHLDTRPWEEEIAYVRREQQIRRIRRDSHADYLRKAEQEFVHSEVGLPAGDFDNYNFVHAATGGRPRWN